MEKIETYFQDWSKKLGIYVEEIQKEYDKVLEDEKKKNNDLTAEEQTKKALQVLYRSYKKQLSSPAIGFEGIVLASEEARDINGRLRNDALEMFRENPQAAISQRVTDEEGNPLDTRRTWNSGKENPGYGKPLQESFVRRIFGVCKESKKNDIKYFEMSLNNEVSKQNIPLNKTVRFRAVDKSESEDKYILKSSSYTKFEESENIDVDIEKLIKENIDFVNFSELQKYHDLNKTDYNRVVAIEGDVSILSLEPTAFGSRIMQLEDSNNFDLDVKGLTCWIPKHINVNFAEGSKVIVLGRTNQGFVKDELGNKTDELGDITINVMGLFPLDIVEVPEVDTLDEI